MLAISGSLILSQVSLTANRPRGPRLVSKVTTSAPELVGPVRPVGRPCKEKVQREVPKRAWVKRTVEEAKLMQRAKVFTYTNTLSGRFNAMLKGARHSRVEERRSTFNLSMEDLQAIWDRQNGKCYYSGRVLSTVTKDINLMSLDRKDNSLGYNLANCVFATVWVNRAKNTFSVAEFKHICQDVAAYCK